MSLYYLKHRCIELIAKAVMGVVLRAATEPADMTAMLPQIFCEDNGEYIVGLLDE